MSHVCGMKRRGRQRLGASAVPLPQTLHVVGSLADPNPLLPSVLFPAILGCFHVITVGEMKVDRAHSLQPQSQ